MVIYLDQYLKAKKTARATVQRRRDEEQPMCVNWSPAGPLSAAFCYRHPHELSPLLPDDLASIDVDAFVDRIYGLASQI